jgi:hypothetical protein
MLVSNIKKEYLINQLYFSFKHNEVLNLYYFNNIDLKNLLKYENKYFINSRLITPLVMKSLNFNANYNVGSFFMVPNVNNLKSNEFNKVLLVLNKYIFSIKDLNNIINFCNKVASNNYLNGVFLNYISTMFVFFINYIKILFLYFSNYRKINL